MLSNAKPIRARKLFRRLGIESLESRRLLAADLTVALDTSGRLRIGGTERPDASWSMKVPGKFTSKASRKGSRRLVCSRYWSTAKAATIRSSSTI